MMQGDDELLDQLRSRLADIESASRRARQHAREARNTAQDKEKLMTATVGGRGELQQIVFHGIAYRDLPPAELADVIVRTVARAREKAQESAMAIASELTGDMYSMGDKAKNAKSIDELVESVIGFVMPR